MKKKMEYEESNFKKTKFLQKFGQYCISAEYCICEETELIVENQRNVCKKRLH